MAGGSYPQITRGLGKLTPSLWRRCMDALSWYENQAPRVQFIDGRRQPRRGGGGRGAFPARITSSSVVVDGLLWRYRWREVEVLVNEAGEVDYPDKEGGLDSDLGGGEFRFAYNLQEARHRTGLVDPTLGPFGYGWTPGPAAGATIQPIVTGGIVDVSLRGTAATFSAPNPFLLACDS